jgi:eukaryotic-like serine/threonine-protein kinase
MTDVVDYLVAHGAYVEAARIAAERGELARAIGLYERVWRFADAWPLALALGDRALAVRLALDGNLPGQAQEIADATAAPEELARVADAFAARGHPFEAARLEERAGAWARAANLYRRADAPLDEARARACAGELRAAGLIYERLVAQGGGGEAADARLALGRLLGRLGRHEEAARHLQVAARTPALRTAAWRALCGPLLALGFHGAAVELLARLRRQEPESESESGSGSGSDGTLPRTPEDLAALEDAEAAAGGVANPGGVGRRFHIRRLLGGGALGRVYEAIDTLLGTPVALKLLAIGDAGGEPERQAYLRFAREAEAAGRLRHPNIVALHDAQPAAGLFVFELMVGGTLADHLAASGPLSLAGARRLALDLLAALGAAHERGIVHRDVKPANICFDAAGNAKLGDFGSAHLADFGQTQTGGFLGTVAYMSPEQITGAPIGFSADLYALGATLTEALTGRPPFLGPDLVGQHLGEAAPLPSSRRAGLSSAHDRVLLRALAKSPTERFASAAEMAEEIAAWPIEGAAPTETGASEVSPPVAAPENGAPVERELWSTPAGRLIQRHDPRTARDVLIEERSAPIEGADLDDLRRIAAAGGPQVQRVLRLSDDRSAVWYETLAGVAQPIDSLAPAERAALAEVLARLPPAPSRLVVRTPAGPVVWVCPGPTLLPDRDL